MAFRNSPHGTSKFTPFYMLHGREMVLPSLQDLKAKIGPEIRNSEHAPRLENLKTNMRSAYKLAREHARRVHTTSKRYYDRGARDRNFPVGGYVYLYSPAVKRGLCSKYRKQWSGTWLITAQKSRLNYVLEKEHGSEIIVRAKRMKVAHSPGTWRRKVTTTEKVRPQRQQRRKRQEEDELEISSSGRIPVRLPEVENRQAIQLCPFRMVRNNMDTPTTGPSPREAPSNHRRDPTYAPFDTPPPEGRWTQPVIPPLQIPSALVKLAGSAGKRITS
jgi:hypothetical protein